ncbi:hypothetical protein EW026_g7678 [Hermanssonia centrifuga]|uniref:Uncharacterized protein n=1 Tax=Hermanssonia centrifuga TaxID=98765 RepID=A0A4S4K709_9APHY|nr:hypothetical protein EW026_g7678 [Hermanssonia centrifuga]
MDLLARRVLIYVANFLEDVFWPRNQARLTSSGPGDSEVFEVEQWDDATILNKYYDAMRAKQGLPESVDGLGQLLIHKITADVVVKRTLKRSFGEDEQVPHEALAINFVRKHTSIPVPRVLRIIDNEQLRGNYLYVMEFIDGQQLGQTYHVARGGGHHTVKGFCGAEQGRDPAAPNPTVELAADRPLPFLSPYSIDGIPKLEEFIPDRLFPDIILVHDPHEITRVSDQSYTNLDKQTIPSSQQVTPKRYKRVLPKLEHDKRCEPIPGIPIDALRIAHLYLAPSEPNPLSAHSRNGRVVVAAKTAFPVLSARKLLANEAKIYDKFPKHLMQDWCGYNLVTPIGHPVPVGPIVPKCYGYYVPENDMLRAESDMELLQPNPAH